MICPLGGWGALKQMHEGLLMDIAGWWGGGWRRDETVRGDRGVGEGIVQVGVVERTVIVGPTPSIAFSENRVDPERPIQIPPSGNPGILAIGRRGVVFQTISLNLAVFLGAGPDLRLHPALTCDLHSPRIPQSLASLIIC